MRNPLTPTVRRYIYGVCIAALPLAIFLGWLPAEASPLLIPLIIAILNVPNSPAPVTFDEQHGRNV